jgi:hypothetical protein
MYPRLYHSTALLLPDARVLIAGSDHQINEKSLDVAADHPDYNKRFAETYEYRMEVYSPPYLFSETPRPIIEEAPKRITYGQEFDIKVSNLPHNTKDENLSAALLVPGSVTHCNNMSQRYVGLSIVRRSETHLTLKAPPDGAIAPPTFYMLFLLNRGVPSDALFVQLFLNQFDKASKANISYSLALWLRGDTGMLADSEGAVSTWADLSGRGNDVFWKENRATDKTPWQRQPVWKRNELNGPDVVRFSIVSNGQEAWGAYMQSANENFLAGSASYAVFLVTHPWPSFPSWNGGLIGWGNFSDSNVANEKVVGLRIGPGPFSNDPPNITGQSPYTFTRLKDLGKAALVTYWGSGDDNKLGSDDDLTLSLSRAVLIETSFDGSTWQMRLNGEVLKENQIEGKETSKGPLTIGRNGNTGDFFRGDIAEIIIYDRKLEDEERKRIEEYLRTRYALW